MVDVEHGRRIGGWWFGCTCSACGGELLYRTSGTPATSDTRAVAECSDCHREILFIVREVIISEPATARVARSPLPDDPNKVHGTRQGYNRGCGCQPCVEAQKAYERTRPPRKRNPEAVMS